MLPIEISFSVEHVEYIQGVVMSVCMMCRKKGNSLEGTELDSLLCPIINSRCLREPSSI
jgi:hypothetical protein